MILLVKKDSFWTQATTRSISLLDVFDKIAEKLFVNHFREILTRKGNLSESQTGFRESFRLQNRLLLFIDGIRNALSNSCPTSTIFVDFRSASDQIWHASCIGKLRRSGISASYLRWINAWLENRKGFRSRWSPISKGEPQGGVLTPTLFISYHHDLSHILSCSSTHRFVDDLTATMSERLGAKYAEQCLYLEKRIKTFIDTIEFYAVLSAQSINF